MNKPAKTFQVDALSVRLYQSEIDMAHDAALIAQKYLRSILISQGTATIILATGNSQLKFLQTLTDLGGLDWSGITCFHLDEYLGIAADHPASFRRYLRERVEQRVHPRQFHYIAGDALQPLEECDRYAQLLRSQPIDLCCLGVGENGHLAFNEPTVANFNDRHLVKVVRLDSRNCQQQVNQGHFSSFDAVPQYALTLTIPTICSAQKILCLVAGKRKAKIVKAILQGHISPACPASVLRKQTQATLFIDTDAASLL
ncbi:MAG: glucosamine-6-phosphate deaminase [Cyanothece sp. SIO1E1]|nr:glucosamine-6-phosphate deaminase [Cyanothece sp. SIO1E1]